MEKADLHFKSAFFIHKYIYYYLKVSFYFDLLP